MEWLLDPTAWAGLLTLVALEIVLGIDNLVFIAILADKLPPHQRDKARIIGLSLALIMRLVLLSSISWLVTLTDPLFALSGHDISGRDLIFLVGGFFLLFKATKELHERLEGDSERHSGPRVYAGFNAVIVQIVVLDAVFSLDSVITAVGMTEHLPIMMTAVTIAILTMMAASKPLTRFVIERPTVIVLCLGFLMMIGFSLIAEGLGFHIPKGYLYAAIGFSILVESFNQTIRSKRKRAFKGLSLRDRTAEAILKLISGNVNSAPVDDEIEDMVGSNSNALFDREEMRMLERVMQLHDLRVGSMMTHRQDIVWIETQESWDSILTKVREHRHSRYPLCKNDIDHPIGFIVVKDLLLHANESIELKKFVYKPIYLPETISVLDALERFRQSTSGIAMVVDEYGALQGIITLKDVMEVIVGTLPEPSYRDDFQGEKQEDGSWLLDGGLAIYEVEDILDVRGADDDGDYNTLAGLIIFHLGRIPRAGDEITWENWRFKVLSMDKNRVDKISAVPMTTYA